MATSTFSIFLDGTDSGSIASTTFADNLDFMSISLWVKNNSVVDQQPVLTKCDPLSEVGWQITLNTNTVTFSLFTTFPDFDTVNASIPDTTIWHNVVVTFNRSTGIIIYVDGVLTASLAKNYTGHSFTNSSPLSISVPLTGPGEPLLEGFLDEIRIWNQTLTISDAMLLSAGGDPATIPIAYWPIEEGTGVVLHDTIAANNFTFNALTWSGDVPPPFAVLSLDLSDSLSVTDSIPNAFSVTSDQLNPVPVPIVEQLTNQLIPAAVKTYFRIQE